MSRYIRDQTPERESAAGLWGVGDLRRRPQVTTTATSGGHGIYQIEIGETNTPVVVGDGQDWFEIPQDLDGAVLASLDAYVRGAFSTSGSIQVQFRHWTNDRTSDAGDVLSGKLTIEANEYNSKTAATPFTISGTQTVSYGDHYRIDVDAAGSGARGLALILYFLPEETYSFAVTGQQGPAGGITAWEGDWQTATGYSVGDAVNNNGTTYVATANHTSGASTEPGVGASWETVWMVLIQGHQYTTMAYLIDGHGRVLDTGVNGPGIPIYSNFTIREASLLADTFGSVVVDIWKDTYGAYPPTDADSITASSPLTLVTANKTTDTTLTGWNTSVVAGDILRCNIDSVASIHQLTVGLKLERV